MKKNLCLLLMLTFLNGCFGSMAFLGSASTTAASGAWNSDWYYGLDLPGAPLTTTQGGLTPGGPTNPATNNGYIYVETGDSIGVFILRNGLFYYNTLTTQARPAMGTHSDGFNIPTDYKYGITPATFNLLFDPRTEPPIPRVDSV